MPSGKPRRSCAREREPKTRSNMADSHYEYSRDRVLFSVSRIRQLIHTEISTRIDENRHKVESESDETERTV